MMLVDEEKGELRVAVANGLNLDLSSLPVRRLGEGIAGTVAERGEAILVRDIREAREFKESEFSGQYKTGSFLCVPIKVLGKTIGVISVNDKLTGEPFSESDLSVLTTFSHQIALTIENTMINADMERYIEKLSLLNEISQTLLSIVDPKEIFKDIARKTQRIIEAEACILFLCDDVAGDLAFEAGFGENGEISQELRVKAGEGVTGWVLEKGEMAAVDNVAEDERYIQQTDGLPKLRVKGLICAPLKIKGKTLGVIKVINKRGGQDFTIRDRELMESIASQSSIALKNAWLYRNLVASIDEVAATNRELERVNTELKLKVKELELLKKRAA
jgi:GAF domain-containing protein